MKFSATTAFVALASLASPALAKSSRRGNGFTPSTGFHQLASRQVVTANICENIPLSIPVNAQVCTRDGENVPIVPGLDLTGLVCDVVGGTEVDVEVSAGICLCLAAGVLTDDSVANIQALIDLGGPEIDLLLDNLGGVVGFTANQLLDALVGDATNLLTIGTTECQYPEGSTPNSCDECTFDCPAGQEVCGNTCITEGDACQSGIARRKRDVLKGKSDFLCAQGQTACSVPSSRFFTLGGYECVDTQADVESCGGCTFAYAGQAQGQDCTAIANAIDVTCTTGACIVQACSEGFEPNFDETKCVAVGTNLGFVIEKRSAEDASPILNLNLESILKPLGSDLNDIDIELLKTKLATIENGPEGGPVATANLESITKLVGVDLNDIDIELLKHKLAKIQ